MSSGLPLVGNQSSYGAGSHSHSSNTYTRFTKYCAETRIAKGLSYIYQRVVGSPNPTHPSKWGSEKLPKVSLEQVSSFLTANELACAAGVCKNWEKALNGNNLVWNRQAQRLGVINPPIQAQLSELNRYQSGSGDRFSPHILRMISEYYDGNVIENAKQVFANPHPAIAFGREEWIRHIGDPGEEPPLPSNIYETLQGPCPFWPGKTIEETHTLVLVPATVTRIVDGRPVTVPLTLRTLDELLKSSNNGTGVGYRYIWDQLLREHGDTPVGESHWVLMTNDIVPESRDRSYIDQKLLVENAGYEVPTLLDAATSILLEHIRSGRRLFSDNPWTCTRCQQTVRGCQSTLGSFAPDGLDVYHNLYDIEGGGVAAARQAKDINSH